MKFTTLNNQFNAKLNELDEIRKELSEIETLVGVAYDDGKEINIVDRLEAVKNKANIRKDGLILLSDSKPSGRPLSRIYVTSDYGYRIHPILRKKRFHAGVDLRAKVGTKVYATANGVVNLVGNEKQGYGKFIKIQHNMGFETFYAHLSKIKVKNGTVVKKGDIIGFSGNTGRSNGPHLHYETRFGGGSILPVINH